jgi:hypothetical protein
MITMEAGSLCLAALSQEEGTPGSCDSADLTFRVIDGIGQFRTKPMEKQRDVGTVVYLTLQPQEQYTTSYTPTQDPMRMTNMGP